MEYSVAPLSSFWVVPVVNEPSADPCVIAVAVGVAGDDGLVGADVDVAASAAGAALAQQSKPDAQTALPITELKGLTAQAMFAFANPAGANVDSVMVTIRGESVTFGVTPPENQLNA